MPFTDSPGKFACSAQFYTFKELQPFFYSYLKALKFSLVSVVKNEQSNPEITFVKFIKENLLAVLNTLQRVTDYL